MLSAAFLTEGPVRNGLSALAGILGALTLIKFFTQWIGPNEAAYRTRNQQQITCHGYWKLTRYGIMYFATEPHYRTYGKGFQFKLPFIYDLQVVSVAEETKDIPKLSIDSQEDVQYDAVPSVTYRITPDASSMFRAVEKSLTLDVSVIKITQEAVGVVLRDNLSGANWMGAEELTLRVRTLTYDTLHSYGVELIRVNLPPCSKSLAEKLKGQPPRVAGLINGNGEITHPHEIPA